MGNKRPQLCGAYLAFSLLAALVYLQCSVRVENEERIKAPIARRQIVASTATQSPRKFIYLALHKTGRVLCKHVNTIYLKGSTKTRRVLREVCSIYRMNCLTYCQCGYCEKVRFFTFFPSAFVVSMSMYVSLGKDS
jgi:hypothetical protein